MNASPAASHVVPAHAPSQPPKSLRRQAAEKFVQVAKTAPLTDGGLLTGELLTNALRIDPHHFEARQYLEKLHAMQVPRWHFPMLGDARRNAAYRRAIEAKIQPGDIVLDVGCGAGMTAMLAARAGAGHVYACESQPLIAQAAREIIQANGLADKVTVIAKPSQDLQIGVDLPEPADFVVSEIVDCVLLGEGAMPTLADAMRRLAKPGARATPERGVLYAQPIEAPSLFDLWRPGRQEGFDFSGFHKFAAVSNMTPAEFNDHQVRALAPKAPLFAFDFARPTAAPGRLEREIALTSDGALHAISATFEMALAPGLVLSNGLDDQGHWGRKAFLLDAPRAAAVGDAVEIVAQHDGVSLAISVV